MRRALAAVALLLASALPSSALARAVQEVSLAADASDVILTVSSDVALHAPYIKTYPGIIRIRMYDARETPVLRLVGDGGAVRSVDVGSGSDQSAALVMTLGDRTKLAPADVRVERDAHQVVFKISRGLLPAWHEGAPSPVVAKPVAPPVVAKPVAPVAQAPVVQPPVAAAPVAPPAPVEQPAPVVAKPAPVAAKPAPDLSALGAKKSPEKQASKPDAKLAQGGSSAMPVLLSVSAILALAYGALRFMQKKNAGAEIPAIDVVAQRRLGPRHQLVIVRAFDRDYLLSIQGGQTTVIARGSRKRSEDNEELQAAPLAGTVPHTSKRAPAPAGRDFEDDEVTFGGELFKTALEQREKAREHTASFRLEAARAEARAELARLDAARDEFAGTLEPSTFTRERERESARERPPVRGRESERALELDRERDRDLERAAERGAEEPREPELERPVASDVPLGMSDSVSGLLRLRKASGR